MPVIVLTADQPQITAEGIASGKFLPEVTANFAEAIWAAQMKAQDSLARLNMATGVTVVVETTKTEKTMTDASALDILREVSKYVTPGTPINF